MLAIQRRQDWLQKVSHPDDNIDIVRGRNFRSGDVTRRCQGPDDWIKCAEKRESHQISSFTLPMVSTEIRCGDTVELKNGAFVRIRQIYQFHQQDPVMFSGDLFERNTRLKGWLPRIENEVFWFWTFSKDEDPELATPFLLEARKTDVQRIWNLHIIPPSVSQYNSPLDTHLSFEQAQNSIQGRGTLTCSWRYVRASDTRINRAKYERTTSGDASYVENSLIAVVGTEDMKDSNDCHVKHIKKGLDKVTDNYPSRHTDNAFPDYTFGDAFAGCGAMSQAAKLAGLNVQWGFDKDPMAISSYTKNFPYADAWADEFMTLGTVAELKADVLHLSPPCHFLHPTHVPNTKDKMNLASRFAIPAILQKSNPRVVTVAEMPYITANKHARLFGNLIQFFTWSGYSIRWKVINCVDYGVAQQQKRQLFMIGSR